jgi:phospholipase C
VSWIVAPEDYSEHPGPSSPVQGGWYMQQVLDALTADPDVWARTVLLVMFDENDGFFDHVPPPCAPSLNLNGTLAGASTVADATERHTDGNVYGPGPRVPLIVVSPWSRGGWVNSQAFDHTSLIRFVEQRFGVVESNVSPWRRAVLGDLTSAFDFRRPNAKLPVLPSLTRDEADAIRAAQEALRQIPIPTDSAGAMPIQPAGVRPARALPYALHVDAVVEADAARVRLRFRNVGDAGAVYHVYDRLRLTAVPRRYTVEAGKSLEDVWSAGPGVGGRYDLWVLGPNGFLRHVAGTAGGSDAARLAIDVAYTRALDITLSNDGVEDCVVSLTPNAYRRPGSDTVVVGAGTQRRVRWPLRLGWYDVTITCDADATYLRRFAGHVENGRASVTDPAIRIG